MNENYRLRLKDKTELFKENRQGNLQVPKIGKNYFPKIS